MGFHPVTGWFGINNVIGWVGFNFPLVFLVGCGMDIKVIRFGYGWEWIGFFAISRPIYRPIIYNKNILWYRFSYTRIYHTLKYLIHILVLFDPLFKV